MRGWRVTGRRLASHTGPDGRALSVSLGATIAASMATTAVGPPCWQPGVLLAAEADQAKLGRLDDRLELRRHAERRDRARKMPTRFIRRHAEAHSYLTRGQTPGQEFEHAAIDA